MIVTTFHPDGYERYGREMLETAVENYPGDILVYYEEKPAFHHEKVEYKPLSGVHGHDQFIAYCNRNPVFSGKVLGGYTYTYDAVRFCHKAFAQFDALQNNDGKVFWVDADTVFKKPIPPRFLADIFDGNALALLQRPGFYTETGFVGFDTRAQGFELFLAKYIDMYRRGLVFTLPGWHDCYALDAAVELSQVPVKNLSPDFEFHNTPLDVIETSVLGEYLDHKKGNRKWATN